MKPRSYQQEAIDSAIRVMDSGKSALLVLPTGCGKTVVFSHIAHHYSSRGRIMVMAHREELVRQAADKLQRVTGQGVEIEMAEQWADMRTMYQTETSPFVVTSVQTQTMGMGGKGRMSRFNPMDFALLVIDEAHHAPAASYRKVIEYYRQNPDLRLVGVTATPDRADKLAMGSVFDEVAYEYGVIDAIDDGYLVPIRQRVVDVEGLDYSGLATVAGDFNQGQLAAMMEREELIHRICSPVYELSAGRKTLIFASSVAHAEMAAEVLNRHELGCAEVVSGTTPSETRQRTLRRYKHGEFRFLVNCGVFTEGFDEPGIELVVMARPTKSRSLYAQMIGRGTRPLDGVVDQHDTAEARRNAILSSRKPYVEVLDFAGNSGKHKLVTATDILAGKYPPAVVAEAKRQVESERDGAVDIQTKLAEVAARQEEIEAELRAKREAEAARKAGLVAKAKYRLGDVSPFDVLDIRPGRVMPWFRDRMPSEAQKQFLARAGVDNIDQLNMGTARTLIDSLIRRRQQGLATFRQVRALKARGVVGAETMTFEQARERLDGIALAEGWRR